MSDRRQSVVIIGAKDEEPQIRRQVQEVARVLASESDAAAAVDTVKQHEPSVALLFLDHERDRILEMARHVGTINGCVSIIVSRERDPDNILVAMRSGARDFAYLDEASNDIRRAIQDLGEVAHGAGRASGGTVITVFSAKGGSGATTIASNLAGSLAALRIDDAPARVVLLDFDLEMGDVLVFLDMTARYSYQELLTNMHRLDSDLLQQSLAKHSSGICVMSQTDHLEEGRDLPSQDAGQVVDFLRGHFDFVVIDGLRDFRETAIVALDKADHIVLTMTQDIPALKNANRCLRIFKRLGYGGDAVKLILNRYRRSGQLSPDAISDALGRRVACTVTNDFPTGIRAVNEGKLIVNTAPGSRIAKDLQGMTSLFHEQAPGKKRGFFALWGKG